MKGYKKLLVILLTPILMLVLVIVGVAGFFSNTQQYCSTQGQGTYYLPAVGGPVPSVPGFNLPEQLQNIAIIRDVGVSRHRSVRDIQIALMVAKQESNIRNLKWGDRDSLGIFQQRPSQGWGTPDQILDPVYATNKFYEALEKVANRDTMPLIEVAIAVQRPNRASYEKTFYLWEVPVLQILAGFVSDPTAVAPGVQAPSTDCSQFLVGGINAAVEIAVQAALSQQGKTNQWATTTPFDNSGFTQWAYQMAGISLPLGASAQYQYGAAIAKPGTGTSGEWLEVLQRGDLLYWSSQMQLLPIDLKATHVAIYLGNGQMIDASGALVPISVQPVSWSSTTSAFMAATRPVSVGAPSASLSNGWRWPLDSIRVTSSYGMRVHPITGVYKLHDGVDFAASMATPVKAAHGGKVLFAGPAGGYGNFVTIDHGGIVTGYAHLSVVKVSAGEQVSAGQVIALSGSTGSSTGPHLHFNVRVNGAFVDPVAFMRQFGLVP